MKGYLENSIWLFKYYKSLGEKAIAQIEEGQINAQFNADSNSISLIVKHLVGNMLSRWTDFLTTDGEKPWRERDSEFEGGYASKAELLAEWERGWSCVFTALTPLEETDLTKIIYIRNEGHTVMEAINRQIAHYAYHVGQIVFLAKALKTSEWDTLSIARNRSKAYNDKEFQQEKERKVFDTEKFYGR